VDSLRRKLAPGGPGIAPPWALHTPVPAGYATPSHLGVMTPDVRALRDQFQVPGTRLQQFAFDDHADNPYLPHNFVHNTVVYTGTHDNATTRQWYEELPYYQRRNLWSYLKLAPGTECGSCSRLLRLAWSSPAALAIAPL
jgi:4-alpha-glucanotransferase